MTNLADHARNWFRVLGKYGISALIATSFDFVAFHLALTWLAVSAVNATVLGRSVGAVIAFSLQRHWVFRQAHATRGWVLVVKYVGGVLLGMALNVSGVWLLHNVIGWAPWPARITSAVIGWFIIFLFNKYVVFKSMPDRRPIQYRV
ncbi:MAG: GtrA family protein [Bacteroidetes bacterium]|nr:MAG: GtrA family protein [Bacteroidota bacterium]